MKTALAILASAVLCSHLSALADVLYRDDFTRTRRYEILGPPCVEVKAGACRFNSMEGDTFLFTPLEDLGEMTARTSLTVEKRHGVGYVSAGLALCADSDNLWRLMLVESPNGKRYMELLERYCGIHQAQSQPAGSGLTLASKLEGEMTTWEYSKTYEFRLALTREAICGEVRDPASGAFWRRTYSFSVGRAVREGRPALGASGLECLFGVFTVEGVLPPALSGLSVAKGREGSILILPDEAEPSAKAPIANRLKGAFEKEGFGVTLLPWDSLGRGRIPVEQVDVVVVADARRLPVAAKAMVNSVLRSRGKILFLGAPGFGELLAKCPEGWVGKERYNEGIVSSLKGSPIALADGPWFRSAGKPERQATIDPAPAEGADCWKLSFDLEGYDSFGKALKAPFPAGHSITMFWAKGDENTPQLSIEWIEADGARWIGTVPLTTSWKQYALQRGDFPYWPDSKAKRGGAGDRLNPQNVKTVKIGLSGSHTPKCKPGPHAFWIRGLASAPDPGREEPDFRLPEVEMVSPSYKLYPLSGISSLAADPDQRILPAAWKLPFDKKGFAPVPREAGRGFDRAQSRRWMPIAEAMDSAGRRRGALISMAIGNVLNPEALWANIALADPADVFEPAMLDVVLTLTRAMKRGGFLIEGGSRLFSYRDGEAVDLGAEAVNLGKADLPVSVRIEVRNADDIRLFQQETALALAPGERKQVTATWKPEKLGSKTYIVRATLFQNDAAIDAISHPLDRLPTAPARPEEFVRVQGSNFYLGGEKWFMRGINYRPTSMAGHAYLDLYQRASYDPAVIERDLDAMQSLGINFISATHALIPQNPDDPNSYRDMVDLLHRCDRRGIKVFYFLPWGRPFHGMDVEKIKRHITVAGIKDNPAILAWELAWEPIEHPWNGRMDFLIDEWNDWVVERYGSVANAESDWGYKLERKDGKLLIPPWQVFKEHGQWDRCVAAFRRFFSDCIGQAYGATIRDLRRFDSRHLITFRGGACGIPNQLTFAHEHSVGVAKHVDFLCPEGYSLMTQGWGNPTPPDDIRKGGLVTLYYRFVSREKPVVWMEFGYTVRGFHTEWETEMVHVAPEQFGRQRAEYDSFYQMFIESGARGAAPWWLPGGFRLGERSDFGVLNEDLTERPACEIMRRDHPKFAKVEHLPPTMYMDMDLDARYADAWDSYGRQYLEAVRSGQRPYLRTAGTGTDSANTPLVAVGNTPCNGHNPPKYLNAEFNRIEIGIGGAWREVKKGETIEVKAGQPVRCRASAGNTGEAKWLAPNADRKSGGVYLAGRKEYGLEFKAPISADTDYLKDAEVAEFVLIPSATGTQTVSFEMWAEGRAYFGQRITITLAAKGEG